MRNEIIIQKIIVYSEKILKYCEAFSDKNSFLSNSMLIESCVFNLSQIGELANKLDTSFTDKHTDIPWRALYGLRNRIIHDYDGVNFNLVWDIIQDDIPKLIISLKDLSKRKS